MPAKQAQYRVLMSRFTDVGFSERGVRHLAYAMNAEVQ